jgi:N-methylhydantoinase A/oxoprolinase/acetone carboxylase beta subunit
MTEVALHKVERLRLGARVVGPAVVAGDTTTIVLEPGDVLRCDEEDSFLIELARTEARMPAAAGAATYDSMEGSS